MSWKSNEIFKDLTPEELAEFSRQARSLQIPAGECIFRENDTASDLFIIESGQIEIVKLDPSTRNEAVLSQLASGDVVGEMALVDRGLRSASARATTIAELMVIPFDALCSSRGNSQLREAYVKILQNLAERLSSRLRTSGEERLKEAVERINMGIFVIATIGLLALYILLLGLMPKISAHVAETSFVSIPLLGIFGLTTAYFLRRSRLSAEVVGLSTSNLRRALVEGVLFSIPIMLLMVLAKWIYLHSNPSHASTPVLEWRAVLDHYGLWSELAFAGVYGLFTAVQEFIARSGLQAPLERFLISKRRALLAIVLSNLLFATTHIHVSAQLALTVFFAGCFWGWMFKRHGNLYGCMVNHLILGTFVFFVLGV
jgi:CRP/FNR family transcriptional regulator, cyclic AMP receptor protein